MKKIIESFFNKKIKSMANELPYAKFQDDKTIILKNDSIAYAYKLKGIDNYALSQEEIVNRLSLKVNFLNSLDDFIIKYYNIRIPEKRKLETPKHDNLNSNAIIQEHYKMLQEGFKIEHYIILCLKHIKLKKMMNPYQALLNDKHQQLLSNYKELYPQRLEKEDLISFTTKLVNLDFNEKKINFKNNFFLGTALNGSTQIYKKFNPYIQLNYSNKIQLAKVLNIDNYPETIEPNVFQELNLINCEIIQAHSFIKLSEPQAIRNLKLKKLFHQRWNNTDFVDVIEEMEKEIQAKETSLFNTSNVIIIKGNDEKDLDNKISTIEEYLLQYGYQSKVETIAKLPVVTSIHPTEEGYNPRSKLITTQTVSSMINPTETSTGTKSHWGTVTHLTSLDNKIYNFNFHNSMEQNALGHTLVIGSSGSGKTVLIEFLLTSLLKYDDIKIRIYDQYKGTYIFTDYLGGKYVSFDGDNQESSINPFTLKNTPINQNFLISLVKSMAEYEENNENRHLIETFKKCVSTIMKSNNIKNKNLSQLIKMFPANNQYFYSLDRFSKDGELNYIFSSKEEEDIKSKLIAYDFTEFLNGDEKTLGIIAGYLNHTFINNSPPSHKKVIFIDETPAYLKSPFFNKFLQNALKQVRKKNCIFLMAIQSAADLFNSKLKENLNNISTYILFPNCGVNDELIQSLELNDSEINFLTSGSSIVRQVLIKKKTQDSFKSEIITVDLQHLGNFLKIFSSNEKDINLYKQQPELYLQ